MSAYYNEIDPKAAATLRELIKQGHIAPGEVDERSILDVTPADLRGFTQCHFFAGFGVWSYALRLAGVADTEPVWTGSCPCQPFSTAGKGFGFTDERHLWPFWHHLIRFSKPRLIFGEQVAGKAIEPWIDLVQADLEAEGYRLGPTVFPSAGVGAPHGRHRTFFVADANGKQIIPANPRGLHAEPLRDSFAGGMADRQDLGHERGIHRDEASPERQDGGRGEHEGLRISDIADDSGIGRLEHPTGHGREPRGAESNGGIAAGGRGAGIVGNSALDRERPQHGKPRQGAGRKIQAGGPNLFSELEYAEPAGSQGHGGNVGDGSEPGRFDSESNRSAPAPGPVNGFWGGPEQSWVLTRPVRVGGRPSLRPVEPGTFPLVDGAPARVGRLRGYGNAINAQAAKEFIQAYLETAGA